MSTNGIDSLWAATASAAPQTPALRGTHQCDVAIIGGGFTGLCAAHHIAAGGRAPLLLEARELGFGASGRNGGVVTAKFRVSFRELERQHGLEIARRMYQMGYAAIDHLETMTQQLSLTAADFQRRGHLALAHTPRALQGLAAEVAWIEREFGKGAARLLSKEEIEREVAVTGFHGGLLSPKAGGVHPLEYLRGIARALVDKGVAVHGDSPVKRIEQLGDRVVVETEHGRVEAGRLIIATNGYSDLTPATRAMHRQLIPFRSAIISTAPLPAALIERIMPGRRLCGDTKRMLRWFRLVGDRLIFGGRGAFGREDSKQAFDELERSMRALFPALEGIAVEHRWSGLVAMTLDYLPHVGRIGERVFYSVGYNGSGVALSGYMGKQLAALSAGEPVWLGPLERQTAQEIPLHALRAPGVRLAAGWQQLLDALGR
ncbi:NAD(P)/FAD-dependent oxidoreductase [Halotalea alkalilenta]|uniref:NAD(P)/FAD-dependent oxidoreductase n=1 Tax=Halotalea alkalilenta TaxID=376489 RepID=UPI000488E07D|nr:FAD-binding oxidoreductase [Halotalea alkalilenta]